MCTPWASLVNSALSVACSGAAGIRATVPLFLMSLLYQTGGVKLWVHMEWLGDLVVTICLGILLLVEVIADLVPVVDHALHGAMTFVHPVAGALAAAGADPCASLPGTGMLLAIGACISLITHATKASTRVASTVGTGGTLNPVMSIAGTTLSFVMVVLSVLFSIAAIICAIGVVCGISYGSWKLYQRWSSNSSGPANSEATLPPTTQHMLDEESPGLS